MCWDYYEIERSQTVATRAVNIKWEKYSRVGDSLNNCIIDRQIVYILA